MREISSRCSTRYSPSVLVTAKRSSDFLFYTRSEQAFGEPTNNGLGRIDGQPHMVAVTRMRHPRLPRSSLAQNLLSF